MTIGVVLLVTLVPDPVAPSVFFIERKFFVTAAQKGMHMQPYIGNNAKPWTRMDDLRLKDLAAHYISPREIALRLGRTISAVYSRAAEKSVPLRVRASRAD